MKEKVFSCLSFFTRRLQDFSCQVLHQLHLSTNEKKIAKQTMKWLYYLCGKKMLRPNLTKTIDLYTKAKLCLSVFSQLYLGINEEKQISPFFLREFCETLAGFSQLYVKYKLVDQT